MRSQQRFDGVPPRSAEMVSTKRLYVVNFYDNPIQHRAERSGKQRSGLFLEDVVTISASRSGPPNVRCGRANHAYMMSKLYWN
jgi:hypothetical protein